MINFIYCLAINRLFLNPLEIKSHKLVLLQLQNRLRICKTRKKKPKVVSRILIFIHRGCILFDISIAFATASAQMVIVSHATAMR